MKFLSSAVMVHPWLRNPSQMVTATRLVFLESNSSAAFNAVPPWVEALTVELSIRGIYVSSGSACTSRVLEPSHVLLAIGRKYEEAHGSILMKISPFNTASDIDYVLDVLPGAIKRIRSLSPVKPEEVK